MSKICHVLWVTQSDINCIRLRNKEMNDWDSYNSLGNPLILPVRDRDIIKYYYHFTMLSFGKFL